MKKLILMSAFIMLILTSGVKDMFSQVSQEWANQFYIGGPTNFMKGNGIALDNNGVVYAVGDFNNDMILAKYNSNGDTTWTRVYNYGPDDRGHDVTTDNSGNIFITGPSWNNVTGADVMITKLNSNGDSLWTRRYNSSSVSDWPRKIVSDDNGNVFVSGHTYNTSANYDFFTIKYNSSGVFQWVKIYNGTTNLNDYFGGLSIDKNGNILVTIQSDIDIVTIKYDQSGTQQWLNKYPGSGISNSFSTDIDSDDNGNIYVCGYANKNYLTIKYNTGGDILWTKMYDGGCSGNSGDVATSLATDGSGNVYVTGGSIGCMGTNQDIATIKYNSIGVEQWSRRYYGYAGGALNGSDYCKEISLDVSGDIYVAGVSFETIWQNFAVIKYDKNGNQKWMKAYGNPGTSDLMDMAVDNSGNVYVTGNAPPANNVTHFNFATVKYSQSNLKLTALIDGFYDNNSNKMIQDTVKILLRNSASPFSIVDSSKSTLDSVGNGTFIFHNASPGTSYYAIIKHRNSLETWSANPIVISSGSVNYDFTTSSDKAYGNNLIQKGNKYCIVSGELDGDGYIDVSDLSILENDFYNNLSGYINSDLNGDLILDASDISIAGNSADGGFAVKSPMVDAGLYMRGLQSGNQKVKKNFSQEKNQVVTGLNDNYPNPFNPSTMISYDLKTSGIVSVKIYDAVGKEVAVLVNEFKEPGSYNVRFDASHLSSGMYYYKLQTNGFSQTKKMLLVK